MSGTDEGQTMRAKIAGFTEDALARLRASEVLNPNEAERDQALAAWRDAFTAAGLPITEEVILAGQVAAWVIFSGGHSAWESGEAQMDAGLFRMFVGCFTAVAGLGGVMEGELASAEVRHLFDGLDLSGGGA